MDLKNIAKDVLKTSIIEYDKQKKRFNQFVEKTRYENHERELEIEGYARQLQQELDVTYDEAYKIASRRYDEEKKHMENKKEEDKK